MWSWHYMKTIWNMPMFCIIFQSLNFVFIPRDTSWMIAKPALLASGSMASQHAPSVKNLNSFWSPFWNISFGISGIFLVCITMSWKCASGCLYEIGCQIHNGNLSFRMWIASEFLCLISLFSLLKCTCISTMYQYLLYSYCAIWEVLSTEPGG